MKKRTKKQITISKINNIIKNVGEFNITEARYDSSPIVSSCGETQETIDNFYKDFVGATTYVKGIEYSTRDINYEDLPIEVLEEVLTVVENFETDFNKTMERCRN